MADRRSTRSAFLRGNLAIIPLQDGTESITDSCHFDLVQDKTWTGYKGYPANGAQQDRVFLHRIIWETENGTIPDELEVDHINRDPRDNRLSNLRTASRSQNVRNTLSSGGRSTYRGVSESANWRNKGWGKRWVAHIKNDKKSQHLGYFDTEEEAHAAYVAAAEQCGVMDYIPELKGGVV
ncbi:MAG: HNH endonuclease [Acidiferrobacteraceae bacterium]|nr:HNH endonuclease [Acidiferrobacteraceae bacterium]